MRLDTFTTGKFATTQTFSGGVRYQCVGLDEVHFQMGGPAWVRVIENGVCLDVFTHLVDKQRPLLVFAQDALVEHRPIPWFYRSKWRFHFPNLNLITFSDPTLYEDRRLRAGYLALPGAKSLVNAFIRRLMSDLELGEEDTIHYGASAGGYHILANSANFPKATHVVDIPRVHFDQKRQSANMPILLQALGVNEIVSALDLFRDSFSVPIERLIYLQHVGDTRFMRSQLPKVLEFIGGAAKGGECMIKNFQLMLYTNPNAIRGHSPMPDCDTVALLKKLAAEIA